MRYEADKSGSAVGRSASQMASRTNCRHPNRPPSRRPAFARQPCLSASAMSQSTISSRCSRQPAGPQAFIRAMRFSQPHLAVGASPVSRLRIRWRWSPTPGMVQLRCVLSLWHIRSGAEWMVLGYLHPHLVHTMHPSASNRNWQCIQTLVIDAVVAAHSGHDVKDSTAGIFRLENALQL